jgi:uncharacterized protein with von Willebrand factor type A (vWA) domain
VTDASKPVFGVETIELDLPPLVGALSRRLHDAGLPITPGRAADFAEALTLVRPIARRRLYWTARAVFVSDPAHVDAFDAVFRSVFGGGVEQEELDLADARTVAAPPDDRPRAEHEAAARGQDEQRTSVSPAAAGPQDEDDSAEVDVPLVLASDEELLGRKSFDALVPEHHGHEVGLIGRLVVDRTRRRTRL